MSKITQWRIVYYGSESQTQYPCNDKYSNDWTTDLEIVKKYCNEWNKWREDHNFFNFESNFYRICESNFYRICERKIEAHLLEVNPLIAWLDTE
jgi:hypothetical protein